MASFFGMGRAPHQLSLRVTYEGYAKNPEDPDAPIPREGRGLGGGRRGPPRCSNGSTRRCAPCRSTTRGRSSRSAWTSTTAGSASNASASPNGGPAGNGANGVGAHQRTSSGNLLKDVFERGAHVVSPRRRRLRRRRPRTPKNPEASPVHVRRGTRGVTPPVRAELVVEECRPRAVRVEVRTANAGGASVPGVGSRGAGRADLTAVRTRSRSARDATRSSWTLRTG